MKPLILVVIGITMLMHSHDHQSKIDRKPVRVKLRSPLPAAPAAEQDKIDRDVRMPGIRNWIEILHE